MRYYFLILFLFSFCAAFAQNSAECISDQSYTLTYSDSLDYKTRSYVSKEQPNIKVSVSFAKDYHQLHKDCDIEEFKFMALTKHHHNKPDLTFNVDIGEVFDVFTEHGISYYVFWHEEHRTYTIISYDRCEDSITSVRSLLVGLKIGYKCNCSTKLE